MNTNEPASDSDGLGLFIPPASPSRASITEEQVFAAADTLQKEGIRPSAAKLRERIGKGSTTTIQAMLEKWRDRNLGAPAAPIPAPLVNHAKGQGAEAATKLLEGLWGPIRDQVAREFEGRLHEMQQRAKETHDDLIEATALSMQLEDRVAEYETQVGALTGRNGELSANVHELEEQYGDLEEQNRDLATAIKESTAATLRATEEANAQRDRATAMAIDLAAARAEIDNLKREDALKGGELLRIREVLAAAQSSVASLESERSTLIRKVQDLELLKVSLDGSVARLQGQLVEATKRTDEMAPMIEEFLRARRQTELLARKVALLQSTVKGKNMDGLLTLLRNGTVEARDKVIDDLLADNYIRLLDAEEVTGVIAETGASGFTPDDYEVTDVDLGKGQHPIRVMFTFNMSGNHHDDRMFAGDQIAGSATMEIDNGEQIKFVDIKAHVVDGRERGPEDG